jgi:hypothetical protein
LTYGPIAGLPIQEYPRENWAIGGEQHSDKVRAGIWQISAAPQKVRARNCT